MLFKNEKEWNRWRDRLDTNSELRATWQKLMDFVSEIVEKLRRLLAEGSFSKATREKVNKDIAELKRFKDLYTEAYKQTRDAVAERTKKQNVDTNSAKSLEFKTNEDYNGNIRHSLKWRTHLNKTQYKQLEKWIRQAGNPESTRITDTANWYKGRIDGEDLFAIYSDKSTVLYERKGKEARAELDVLLERLEEIENGRSIAVVSQHINTLLSGDWLQEKHNLANNNAGFGGRGSNTGYASVLQRKPSKFIGSQAFRNVVKKLFDIQEKTDELSKSKSYSFKDSEGNTLTKEQQEYFKDSKVRDKNGNLLVMYHGTPNADFTIFRSGTYFTEHKWYADRYQAQGASSLSYKKTADNPGTYEVYINIKKPFDMRNKAEREIFYDEYYRQYGTGTDLMESGLPDWMDGIDLQEFLEEKGYDYDGLILDEGAVGGYGDEVVSRGISYVTFSPEQAKNIDNLNPTTNPDINFSLKGGMSSRELLDTIEDTQKGKKGAAEKLSKYVDGGGIRTKTYDELIEKHGVIPTGENPHRDTKVPRKTEKNKKVSQTVRTILEAKATPDEAVALRMTTITLSFSEKSKQRERLPLIGESFYWVIIR